MSYSMNTTTPTTTAANFRTPVPASRLPKVGTTIFTVMSALAAEHQAVNLGQGFPDFEGDPQLVDAVTQAMRAGLNQYPPMAGVLPLRQAVSDNLSFALWAGSFSAKPPAPVSSVYSFWPSFCPAQSTNSST